MSIDDIFDDYVRDEKPSIKPMTALISESELLELEALCEKATPGEWHVQHAVGTEISDDQGLCIVDVIEWHPNQQANAAFIARARTAVPELVQEVRRLRKIAEARWTGRATPNPDETTRPWAEWNTDDDKEPSK